MVRLLLKWGTGVYAQGESNGSALLEASGLRDHEFARLLLDHGADVSAQGRYCGSAPWP